MTTLLKIAVRNLTRYSRRTLLTASLIALGVMAVVVFGAVAGGFTRMMIGQMTGSMLGDLQIHRAGYVASIENLPLTLNLTPEEAATVEDRLRGTPAVMTWSPRLKFGAVFSNYAETTNIRLNGVYPDREFATVPLLRSRVTQGTRDIRKGEMLVPELLATGLTLDVGDTIVVIATNRDGSVNAAQLRVGGVIEGISGPGGRDGYLHMNDAAALLRLEAPEVSEIAIKLREFDTLDTTARALRQTLGGREADLEVHTWEALSPFYNIALMIEVLTASVRIGLIAIVLLSIMNVMLMSVYERVREIGTMAAMGTAPGRILAMFVLEGLTLGVAGAAVGSVLSAVAILALRASHVTFDFGRQTGLVLEPALSPFEMVAVSGVVVAVAVAASVQPAFKAARMQPVAALKHG